MKEQEKYSRRNNVLSNEESAKEVVKLVAFELGVTLREFDICAAHRLPNKKRTPSFCETMDTKTELVKRAKRKRLNIQGTPIYIGEHLTSATKLLLREAKQFKRENRIQFSWTRNGDLFVKRSEGDTAKKIIRGRGDLNEFREKHQ